METITKEALIRVMTKYNQEYFDNPGKFDFGQATAEEAAKLQVDYIFKLYEKEK